MISVLKRIVCPRPAIAAFVLFAFLGVSSAGTDLYRDISDNGKLVFEVYKRVMTNYADQVDPGKLALAGIEGMLSELDPYTVYLQREDQEGLNMLTKGRYGGVGIQLGVRDDSLTVIAPMENTPAQRSGILPGDRIVAIDGVPTKDMSLDKAARRIRGEKGTKVVLTILRYDESEPIDFELIRDNIKVDDVSYSGIIQRDIGYVRLSRFSKNSPTEVRKAFLSLKEQGISKLILDLRGNPGGLLESAIRILEMVIEKDREILSTRGRSDQSNRHYVSKMAPSIDHSISLAVLIDGGSASASEIVAGAIQDLDRGIIVGSRSFGKGLVQSVFPLDQERSLKLTTAKYYIPSGRLIQRPGYMDEGMVLSGTEEDSVFATSNGREVLANGGIAPDIEVEPMKVPALTLECWRRGLFFKFASLYLQDHDMALPLVIDDAILDEFADYLDSKDLTLNIEGEKQFKTLEAVLDSAAEQNPRLRLSLDVLRNYFDEAKEGRFDIEREELTIGLEREFSALLGGIAARIESSFDDDPVILKAIEVLGDQMTYDHMLNPSEF